MQRLGVSAVLPDVLADLGVDLAPILAELGLRPEDMRPDAWFAFPVLLTLLQRAVEISGCEHLGLLVGQRFEFAHHGVIGQLMQSAPTLGQAIQDFVTWQPGYSSGAVVYLQRGDPDFAFGYGAYAGASPGTWPLYDAVIAIAMRMIRLLVGPAAQPVELHLTHGAPKDPAAYSRLLRCQVQFNRHRTCAILDADTMRLPLPSADPVARKHLLEVLGQHGRWSGSSWTQRVRHEVRRAMFVAMPGMPAVADRLGISVRTLRRKLSAEGTSFESLRDEVGFSVAREMTELTDLPMADIAASIGFASPSVFSESFNRWSGTSPTRWRKIARARQNGLVGPNWSAKPANPA